MSHELETILAKVNGNTIVSLDMVTIPTLLGGKANPHQGKIRKITIGSNVMLFSNQKTNGYKNMVIRRLVAEGKDPASFEIKPRRWGERMLGTPFVQHEGSLYLEAIFLHPGKSHYELGLRPIEPSQIEGLKPATAGEQGGLDNKVYIRTIACENIMRIVVNKKVYTF